MRTLPPYRRMDNRKYLKGWWRNNCLHLLLQQTKTKDDRGMNMKEYHKINTMFKRNMEGDKKIIFDEWAEPEVEYLKNNQWTFTEKVDGTNIRIYWDGENVTFGGRTDSAQIPNGVINRLNELFYSTPAKQRLKEVFPDGEVVFYGEGYGAKIQKGGENYKAEQDFVLFDVNVAGWWLERHNVEDVAEKLQLEVVPVIGQGTLYEAIDLVKAGITSKWGDFEAEGIVARPSVELTTRNGSRIIAKIKSRDFVRAGHGADAPDTAPAPTDQGGSR